MSAQTMDLTGSLSHDPRQLMKRSKKANQYQVTALGLI